MTEGRRPSKRFVSDDALEKMRIANDYAGSFDVRNPQAIPPDLSSHVEVNTDIGQSGRAMRLHTFVAVADNSTPTYEELLATTEVTIGAFAIAEGASTDLAALAQQPPVTDTIGNE